MGGSQEEINSAPMMTGGKDAISACGRLTPYVDPAFFFLVSFAPRKESGREEKGKGKKDREGDER